MKEETENKVKEGKPWKNESFFKTFAEADKKRKNMLLAWESSEQHEGMQVKVKRLSERYVVKTRVHPDYMSVKEIKKEKNRGKNSRRNRANSERRMFDASAIV